METQTENKNPADNKSTTGQDPDRYEQGYGSFTEKDYDKEEENNKKTADTASNPPAPADNNPGKESDSNSTSS